MKKLSNIHPGEILNEEFLISMNVSAYRLSKETHIPQTRISEIVKGNRRITADTALRLSCFFGNSAKFWLGLQDDYDIEVETKVKELILKNYTNSYSSCGRVSSPGMKSVKWRVAQFVLYRRSGKSFSKL